MEQSDAENVYGWQREDAADSEYSSDSSDDLDINNAGHQQANRQADHSYVREPTNPQFYKFAASTDIRARQKTGVWRAESEGVEKQHLRDFVKYSRYDLLTISWHLASIDYKTRTHAPFFPLPVMPEVLQGLSVDAGDVAKFMCLSSNELYRRHEKLSPETLRSLPVRAAADISAACRSQISEAPKVFDDSSLNPKWEADVSSDDDSEDEGDGDVKELDFCIAMTSMTSSQCIEIRSIKLLNGLVNRCIKSSRFFTLHCWGISRITQSLLRIIGKEMQKPSPDEKLVAMSLTLAYKLSVGSCNMNAVLALLRWSFHNRSCAERILLPDAGALFDMLNSLNSSRVKLLIPKGASRGQVISVVHSLNSSNQVRGLCAVQEKKCSYCVMLTDSGVMKIELRPPFSVVLENSHYTKDVCCGMFVEGSNIAVIGESGVDFLSIDTLEVVRFTQSPVTPDNVFSLYVGENTFKTPYFSCGRSGKKHPYFNGNTVSGTVECTAPLLITRGSDSLSVQFFILPEYSFSSSELTLLALKEGDRNWLTVTIVGGISGTIKVVFKHGFDCVAEIDETVDSGWLLISATMSSVNDTATWTTYCNGVQCSARGQSGSLVKPSGGLTLTLLSGTFRGFISSLQVWDKAQHIGDMRLVASGGESSSWCSFQMNEEAGISLHCRQCGAMWRGNSLLWKSSPKELPARSSVSVIPWKPRGAYYILTNQFEIAVIENDVTTWIALDGSVVDQQESFFRASDLCFYCPYNANLLMMCHESLCIRYVITGGPATSLIRDLPSVISAEVVTQSSVDGVSAVDVALFVTRHLNSLVLFGDHGNSERSLDVLSRVRTVSLKTIGRLLSVCQEIVDGCGDRSVHSLDVLILCFTGRLLIRQVKLMERRCPSKVVPQVDAVLRFIQEAKETNGGVLDEAESIFSELHKVVLAESVSHDYQMNLIVASADFAEVEQLLTQENLPALVSAVIRKDMKKSFMSYLHRLRDACGTEATELLSGKPHSFDASNVMLTTLTGMLQNCRSYWALVAVALLNSISENILRIFEHHLLGSDDRASSLQLLKQTAIGVVVYPLAHYFLDMVLDQSVAADVLKLLHGMFKVFSLWTASPQVGGKPSTQHSLVETYSLVTSPQSHSAHAASIDLKHAKGIRVDVSFCEPPVGEVLLVASLICGDLRRLSKKVECGQTVSFDCGGELTISSTNGKGYPSLSIVIHAEVELVIETELDWLSDICCCLRRAIITGGYASLLSAGEVQPASSIRRDSIHRAGLTNAALSDQKCDSLVVDYGALPTAHSQLLALAEGDDTCTLTTTWKEVYRGKNIPNRTSLECVVKWCACAIAWHCTKHHVATVTDLKEELSVALDHIKRRLFLLLEARQLGKEDAIVARAKYLLVNIHSRQFMEAQLSAANPTEEPVDTRQPWATTRSANHSSRRAHFSSGAWSRRHESMDLSTSANRLGSSSASMRSTFQRNQSAITAVSMFKKGIETADPLPNQLTTFLFTSEDTPDDLQLALLQRTRRAADTVETFRLLAELAKSCVSGKHDDLSLLLDSYLQYRVALATSSGSAEQEKAAFNSHYTDHLVGCGLLRELELQQSVCGFVQAALRAVLHQLLHPPELPLVECLQLCAVLCHPWDSVDISLLRPSDMFLFLQHCLSSAFAMRIDRMEKSDREATYVERKGLFDLALRCLVMPNSVLPISTENARVVDGDVQGIHVEHGTVVCVTRNQWKPLNGWEQLPAPLQDGDAYANFGLPCIVSQLPDVQYFEITIDLVVRDPLDAAIGISELPLPTTGLGDGTNAIWFGADGRARFPGGSDVWLSEPWQVEDVIGCGVFAPHNSVFFTRNGVFLGIVTRCSYAVLSPFIKITTTKSVVRVIVNFGREPFKLDLATLHCSCRYKFMTSSVVSDAVVTTVCYLLSMCHRNFMSSEPMAIVHRDAISSLLEHAATFLSSSILELLNILNVKLADPAHPPSDITEEAALEQQRDEQEVKVSLTVMLSRLFHCLRVAIECLHYDAVTPATHSEMLQLCAYVMVHSREVHLKLQAAKCLILMRELMSPESLLRATERLDLFVSAERVVETLVELAHINIFAEDECKVTLARWSDDTTIVRGKNSFFGATPMPSTGTHTVGFRFKRAMVRTSGKGSNLGGCYYVGLCSGQPRITNMQSVLSRNDIFVLQDCDDKDQVEHLELRRNAIPLNLRGRIYGHDEVVWVEYNADLGEITFFRENVCLGVGFRNVLLGEDLYPMVFSFNDDATCEIVEAPGKTEESLVKWISKLHRSTAIHALQHLHLVPFFAPIIQRMITRSIAGLEQQFTECLIGLATLGSERSYMYCQHSAYGLVVVEMVSDVTGLAVVYIADDPSKHFFTIEPNKLTPYFVCPPIYAERVPVAHSCAKLLTHTLQHSLVDASFFSPLTLEEEERRAAIEEEYHSSLDELSTLDLLSLLHATHQGTPRTQDMPLASDDFVRAQASVANSILQRTPVIVEPKYSTKTIFSPHPSIGVATAPGPTIIRGNALEMSGREELTFAVSLPRTGDHGDLLYVGITTSTSRYPDQQLSEVAHWEDTWALCSKDSSSTNNTHCCVEPTMIFNGEETLFSAQDVLLLRLHSEGSLEFSRLRGGRREDFGVLFENIPLHHAVMDSDEEEDEEAVVFRPFIACGEGTYAVWSFMDAFIFPARMTVSPSSLDNLVEGSVQCGVCGSPLGTSWYVNHRTTLCNSCFIMWQQPLETFCRMDPQDASMSLRYLVSPHKPKELLLGHYVEFEESPMLSWSPEKSVNMTTMGGCCLATRDECIAVTESFSSTGQTRVDLLLHYVAGAAGFPFGGLLPFSPLWRQGGNTTSHIDLAANDVRVSTSVIPPGTKAFFTLQIREVADTTSVGESTEIRDLFLGLTNNTSVSAAAEQTVGSGCRSTVERLRMEGSLWGLWCDKIISPDGRILVLIDTLHGRLSLSSSMVGLRHAPTVLTFSVNPGEPLHILLSSSEACRLTAWEGFISGEERTVPSFVPIAVGLLPDDFDSWSGNALEGAVLLADTVAHTKAMSPTPWVFAEGVTPSQSLFRMGDPITLIQDGAEVRCYCRGLPIASTTLSPCQVASRHRVVVSLSVQGLCATVVPPLWGRARVGRIQRVCSPEVCLVECPLEEEEKREKKMVARGPRLIPVRRRNVRYCVVAATYAPSFPEGLPVVYKIRWMPPKRGVLASVQPHCFGVQDVHCVVSVQPECCFIADNEDCTASVQAERPSVVPPRDTVSRIFEVGKLRYRMQGKRSFNGIMFDCRANTPITLTGLLIMSQTAGRHRVDVFYKKDSHIGFEHNANAWTIIYSGDVDMNPDTFYPVIFPPVGIEAMSSFALYLNTSHNCGVGFYADEDSCTGAVGTELDTDGVLTVYMGKPSSSSNDFMDISTPARGFLGTILYEHHSTAPVPAPSPSTGPALTAPIRSSMGALSSSSSSGRRGNTASLPLRGERFILSSRPLRTATAPSISFEMEVLPPSLHLSALSLPILLPPTTGGPVGVQHALLSVSLASGSVKGGAGGKGSPAWVWRSRELLTHPTTAVQLPLDLCLRQGRYILSATVHPIRSEDEEGTEPSSPQDIPLMLHAVDGVSFCRRNHVVAVYGFVGDLRLEMEALPVSSLLRTMTTGATLNQGNAASYNGIMFDLCSKVELTIERMLFVSQTSADMVLVRLYWKEGSMRGAENSPTEWREVTASYINLVDRQHYSPGPLSLHMKPGRRYSVYLNTTSSCGVRFFNSSDGFSQAVGEEFESDGILTLFVGKKCESSTPFAQIPDEARAFRGKVEYRTYTPHTDIPTNQAIFSCPSAFVVTRLLVALYAYVNATEDGVVSPEEDEEGGFAYRQLLDALAPLATAPLTRVEPALSMNAIENATFQLMDELSVNEEEDNCFSLSMRPRAEVGEAASTFSSGDLAILVEENLQDASLVRLCSDARPDGTIFVQTDKSEETIAVVERRLLPIARCLHCDGVYAAEPSSCPHHRPPATEEARIEAILSRRIANTFAVAPSEAAALATALFDGDSTSVRPAFTSVEELRALQRPEHREVVVVRRQSREHSRNTATEEKEEEAEIRFQVPSYLLLPEGVVGPEDGLLCPMAFHPTLQAAFSLYLRPHRDGVEMFFITDLPERWRKEETQRSSAGKVAVSREACFHLHPYLVMEDGVTTEPLSPTPFVFLASSAGRSLLFLLTCAPPYRGTSGTTIEIGLFITAAPLPAITSPAGTSSAPRWGWESGSVSEALSPRSPAFLDGTFGGEAWPRSKPRTCAFVAMCLDKKDTTLFLELVVVRASNTHGSSSSSKSVDCRARFNVLSGEVVSIFFAPDGDVLVYDADDVVRCHLSEREMRSAQQHRYRLGILCLEPTTRVVAQLDLPEPSFRGWRGTPTAEAGRRADAYIPSWQRHDPQHICISRQGLTARFLLDGRTLIGGQVVLGNPLPSTGVSAFIMQIDRRDRKPGTSLGSGHFAGIAVASFSRPAPSYGYFKGTVDQVWVVQDIQDSDSMPNQAELPPLHMEGSNPILFSAGTKLRFTVDRPRRTLSLARDDESPRVIFSDLPPDVVVCPFVRLDNSYSSATLSRCTPHALLPSSSSANRLDPHALPITRSHLRRRPLAVVMKLFPVMRALVQSLPSAHAARLLERWTDSHLYTRFDYRASTAMDRMIELGAFEAKMMSCDDEECAKFLQSPDMRLVLDSLVSPPTATMAVFPCLSAGQQRAYFELPAEYELLHRLPDANMARLLYLDPIKGPVERSLCLVEWGPTERTTLGLRPANEVLPHPGVVQERLVLRPLNDAHACAIVIDGWYDTTLEQLGRELRVHEAKKVASTIICALEHWHLHRQCHGHFHANNVLLRVVHGEVVASCLWRMHLGQTVTHLNPALLEGAPPHPRSLQKDLCDCAALLRTFPALLEQDAHMQQFTDFVVDGVSITDAIRESELLQNDPESEDSPTLSLQSGLNHRGGSGSYHGIMFDLVAKNVSVRITAIHFMSDYNGTATVRLYARRGTFLGAETDASQWHKVFEHDMQLSSTAETIVTGFPSVVIPSGDRAGFFLHTTNGSGVLFFSESDGIKAGTGQVESENADLGITVGKKSENSVPFSYIKADKRLLRGTIAYSLLMCGHAPRSSLVYSSKEVFDGRELPTPPPTPDPRVVPITWTRKEEAEALGSHTSESYALVLDGCEGDSLQLRIAEDLSFRMEPHRTAHVPPDNGVVQAWNAVEAAAFSTKLEGLRQRYQQSILAGCQPPNMERGEHEALRWMRSGADTSLADPLLGEGEWWRSTPLTTSSTISLWAGEGHKIHLRLRQSSAEGEEVLLDLGDAADHVWFLDLELGCIMFPDGDSVQHPSGCLRFRCLPGTGPVSVEIRLADSSREHPRHANIKIPLWSYVLAQPPLPPRSVCAVLRACDPENLLWPRPVLHMEEPSSSPSSSCTTDVTTTTSFRSPFLVHVRSIGEGGSGGRRGSSASTPRGVSSAPSWKRVPWVSLSSSSSEVEVVGQVAQQTVFRLKPSQCRVVHPRVVDSDRSVVTLRLVFRRTHPIKLQLEAANFSLALPLYAMCSVFEECFTESDMMDVMVQLYFDLAGRSIMVHNLGSGAVCEVAFPGRECPTQLQLTANFHYPGSWVEVLSWWQSERPQEVSIGAQALRTACMALSLPSFTSNVSPTVGTILRHTYRPEETSQDGEAHSAAKMGGLMVGYARLLLESAILSHNQARRAANRSLHRYLACTSSSSSAKLAVVVFHELQNGSLELIAQSCAYLLRPPLLQSTAGVDASVHTIAAALDYPVVRQLLQHTVFGPSLTVSLIHTATVGTRGTRHTAMLCARKILSQEPIALPPQGLLIAHLAPLLRMVGGLCRRERLSSMVVQIGITMVADLIQRGHTDLCDARRGHLLTANIPYHTVVCTRRLIRAILADPPTPLPAALVRHSKAPLAISCAVTHIGSAGAYGLIPALCTYQELHAKKWVGTLSMEVELREARRGVVVVGWNSQRRSHRILELGNPQEVFASGFQSYFPTCGYYIMADGWLFLCNEGKRSDKRSGVSLLPGDRVRICCSIAESSVRLTVVRGRLPVISTNFHLDDGVGLPFFSAQHLPDVSSEFQQVVSTRTVNLQKMYADLMEDPTSMDVLPAQSFDFFTELNVFHRQLLAEKHIDLGANPDYRVPIHFIAPFPLLATCVEAGFGEDVGLQALVPYSRRLQLFDSVTAALAPMVNLEKEMEPLELFRILKNLCSTETEESIQAAVLQPFQKLTSRKGHVTIHPPRTNTAGMSPQQVFLRSVYGQVYVQLHQTPRDIFYASPIFQVKFAGFASTDAGGPYRDLLSQLATEIMSPHPSQQFQLNPLFAPCVRGEAAHIMPNATLLGSEQMCLALEFFGKLLASFFISTDVLAVKFPSIFWKLLLGERCTIKDLAALDANAVRHLDPAELMERTEEELEEFVPGISDMWSELLRNHSHGEMPAEEEDASLPPRTLAGASLLSARIVKGEILKFSQAMNYIRQGFDEVIALHTLQAFRWQKVELLICGTPKLSVEAFLGECDVELPDTTSTMFRSFLAAITDDDRGLLLRFTTGQSRLPIKTRMKVVHLDGINCLPTSATCFSTLRIPSYSTLDHMTERVLYAIRHCKAIDADGQPVENLMLDF